MEAAAARSGHELLIFLATSGQFGANRWVLSAAEAAMGMQTWGRSMCQKRVPVIQRLQSSEMDDYDRRTGPSSTQRRAAEPEPTDRAGHGRPPGSAQPTLASAAFALQRSLGNRAAGTLIQSLARAKGKKAKPPAKPVAIGCTVDNDGTIHTVDGTTVIGFRDSDGTAYATPSGKAPAVAQLGTLQTPDGHQAGVVTLLEVVLAATSGATTFSPKKKGRTLGVLADGSHLDAIVMRSGFPVQPADMPASVKAAVKTGTRLTLQGARTSVWRLVDFPSKDRKTITPTWVQSNHDRKEFEDRRNEIGKERDKLPSDLAGRIEDDLDIMAMVSIIEGPWSSKSPSWDKEASLGVFQWGAEKAKTATTSSSLGGFYKTLEARSKEASKTAAADRSETDQFYIDAWQEATDAGLSISGDKLQIGGKDATGGEVETALATPMGTGKLRSYQLVAAKDWLDDLRSKTVRPMTYGATMLHSGFSAKGPTITDGDRSIVITQPSWATTVGAVCSSKKALALMANLLVNRPAWVNTVVWRTLAPDDAQTQASTLVSKLKAAQDAAEAAVAAPAGSNNKKKKPKKKPKITSSNAADAASYKALQELVFPRTQANLTQTKLIERLFTISLEMYRIENTTPTAEERAKRLVTTDVIDAGASVVNLQRKAGTSAAPSSKAAASTLMRRTPKRAATAPQAYDDPSFRDAPSGVTIGPSALPAGTTTADAGTARIKDGMVGGVDRVVLDGLPGKMDDSWHGADADHISGVSEGKKGKRGRAIAAIPHGMKTSGPLTLVIHLHGMDVAAGPGTSGMRETGDRPEDVRDFQIEQQLGAFASKHRDSRVAVLMPLGVTVPGMASFGIDDWDGYIDAALHEMGLSSEAVTVYFSAHSGSGFELSSRLSNPRWGLKTHRLGGVFAFESFHSADIDRWATIIRNHLTADLIALQGLQAGSADQVTYLRDNGFRFAAFAGSKYYTANLTKLRKTVLEWFAAHKAELETATAGNTDVLNLLWRNYQVTLDHAGHMQALSSKSHFESALESMRIAARPRPPRLPRPTRRGSPRRTLRRPASTSTVPLPPRSRPRQRRSHPRRRRRQSHRC